MTNSLHVGFNINIELPDRGYLYIGDEVPDVPKARVFDPALHSFNPLKNIDYKKARQLAEVLYTISPQGENTLTVRNGKRGLLKALLTANRLDRITGDEEVTGMVGDLLASPVLTSVLCKPTNFAFAPNSRILARINRAELGDFDALVLGLFLIGHFKGQLVIPDFDFYGRDAHVSLIREERLIAGVATLAALPVKLRQSVLLIKDKQAQGATFDDAEILATYARLQRGSNKFNDFVDAAMGS
jgi:hypothetical protein